MTAPPRDLAEPAPAREAPDVIELPRPRPRRRGGVRRKAVDPANAEIHLRMTPDRKATIRADAKRAGMTVTDYLLRNEARRRARRQTPIFGGDPVVLVKMLAELGKWGSNWNQLARDRNMRGQEPEAEELRLIREALVDMRGTLMRALGR
jgi:hypothetical protein